MGVEGERRWWGGGGKEMLGGGGRKGRESNQQDSARIRCPPFVVSLTISFQLERQREPRSVRAVTTWTNLIPQI